MPTKMINCKLDIPLAPGHSKELWWNNANPRHAVYTVQAVPLPTGDSANGFDENVSVEVVRVWRKFIVNEKSNDRFSDTDTEDEIHYVVKNVGTQPTRFNVYISVVS